MNTLKIKSILVSLALAVGFISCDDNESSNIGKASISITDAALDAENVSSVNLAVSEIRATSNNEVSTIVTFEEPVEFNLMAYQNGDLFFLGEGDLEAGTYSDIRLIISENADSYIEFQDGTTESITIPSGTTSGYKINGDFTVNAESTTEMVADVDLRKALVLTGEGTYLLRPTARLVEANVSGTIEGTVEGSMQPGEQYVVLAYKKGTYTDTEDDEPIDGRTRFEGAINSARVSADGSYTLAFMEPDEYELVVVSYTNFDDDEDLEYTGQLSLNINIGGSVAQSIHLETASYVAANIILL